MSEEYVDLDKFDPYWYLKEEHKPGIISQFHLDPAVFTKMTNPGIVFNNLLEGALKGFIIDFFNESYRKKIIKGEILYFIYHAYIKKQDNHLDIHKLTFDFTFVCFLQTMCWIYSRNEDNNLSFYFQGALKNEITKKLGGGFNGYLNTVQYLKFKRFVIAPVIIKHAVYTLLINLYTKFELITKREFDELCAIYIVEKHTDYEKILPNDKHPLQGCTILQSILNKERVRVIPYFEKEYNDKDFAKAINKLMERFYKGCQWDDIPYQVVMIYDDL